MDSKTLRAITRRHFFRQSGFGIGGVALSALLDERLFAQQGDGPFAPRAPHFAPKAKQIIYLFMAGAPTQLDLFDNKPALQKYDGTVFLVTHDEDLMEEVGTRVWHFDHGRITDFKGTYEEYSSTLANA